MRSKASCARKASQTKLARPFKIKLAPLDGRCTNRGNEGGPKVWFSRRGEHGVEAIHVEAAG